MVVGIIGESCVGKSAIAEGVKEQTGAEIITGKEYLRLAKSESVAADLFRKKLQEAVNGETVIYVISEKEQLAFLPEKAVRVLVTADLDTIKRRFSKRMNGNLPEPVGKMLERKHGMFEEGEYDLRVSNEDGDLSVVCAEILRLLSFAP